MKLRLIRGITYTATGLMMFQAGGCTTTGVLDVIQTVFLGISAAGAYAILRNV